MTEQTENLSNIAYCTRYAFMPNRLHLCGPENQADVLEFYSQIEKPKNSIEPLLKNFETMFPYLKMIARENNNQNPFDQKIIEAYWVGNEKTAKISKGRLYNHLQFDLQLDKSLGFKNFANLKDNFNDSATPHHNFHVFSVLKRTGNTQSFHTLATMDACRISWGIVDEILPNQLKVRTRTLAMDKNGRVFENDFTEKTIQNNFEGVALLKGLKKGDCVSIHWGAACEKLNKKQIAYLNYFTQASFKFINLK